MEELSHAEIKDELKKLGIEKDVDRTSCIREYERYRKLAHETLNRKPGTGKSRTQ